MQTWGVRSGVVLEQFLCGGAKSVCGLRLHQLSLPRKRNVLQHAAMHQQRDRLFDTASGIAVGMPAGGERNEWRTAAVLLRSADKRVCGQQRVWELHLQSKWCWKLRFFADDLHDSRCVLDCELRADRSVARLPDTSENGVALR